MRCKLAPAVSSNACPETHFILRKNMFFFQLFSEYKLHHKTLKFHDKKKESTARHYLDGGGSTIVQSPNE
jgi:hypothetical protein